MNSDIGVGIFFIINIIIFLVIFATVILGTVFWIWMLIDCMKNEPNEGNDKLIWVLVILLTHLLGGIVYYVVRRPQRIAQTGR